MKSVLFWIMIVLLILTAVSYVIAYIVLKKAVDKMMKIHPKEKKEEE